MSDLSAEIVQCAVQVAQEFDVTPALHPDDHILGFLLAHKQFHEDSNAAVRYYFENGRESATKVSELTKSYWKQRSIPRFMRRPIRILDFASGYGCVTRHLVKLMPNANILACDIHRDAVTFIEENIGPAVQSASVPEELELHQKFDVIFALSFFTHIPDRAWGRWLNRLLGRLTRGGILIFTANGAYAVHHFPEGTVLDADGYYFLRHSEQKDLSPDEYGSTITSTEYVKRQISQSRAELVHFDERSWYGNQDTYVVKV